MILSLLKRPLWGALSAVLMLIGTLAQADPDHRFYFDRFAGVMTEGVWEQALNPFEADFADSALVGVGFGWDRRLGQGRFRFGAEVQAVAHAGRQDHFEVNAMAVLRYLPPNPVPRRFESFAFGLGLSHASEVPQVEIDRSGASQRTFVYWYGELEFDLPDVDNSAFLRLHHRSDGYGFFETDSGSTAITIGLRVPM